MRAAGLAALAAGLLLAAAPAGAKAPPGDAVFVHSAKSGEYSGGRLTLHGVRRHVTWSHHSGRAGVTRVKHLHRRLFAPGAPAATGTLHVAGHRGGDALTFKLSRPRHNHARRTVSYRAKPLGNGRFPSRAALAAAAAAASQFGTASLSIQGAQVTSTPTLLATNDVYGPGPPHQHICDGWVACWGTIIGTGLAPWSSVKVTINNEWPLTYIQVGADGNLVGVGTGPWVMNNPCPQYSGGNYSFRVDGTAPDGTALHASADPPPRSKCPDTPGGS